MQDLTPKLIDDFAWELQMNRNLLAALAGPSITLTVDTPSGALPVQMNCEDLTRASTGEPCEEWQLRQCRAGGRIRLTTSEVPTRPDENSYVLLNIEDNGPGIPCVTRRGYSMRVIPLVPLETDGLRNVESRSTMVWGSPITRSIVERGGGRIHAANHADPLGTCFQIELPARVE